MPRSVQPPRVVNIEDLRRAAKARLPRVVFDYIDGGAEAELTLRANSRAFEAVTFRPRCAVATPACDLRTTVLGTPLSMSLLRRRHPSGTSCICLEAATARYPRSNAREPLAFRRSLSPSIRRWPVCANSTFETESKNS